MVIENQEFLQLKNKKNVISILCNISYCIQDIIIHIYTIYLFKIGNIFQNVHVEIPAPAIVIILQFSFSFI